MRRVLEPSTASDMDLDILHLVQEPAGDLALSHLGAVARSMAEGLLTLDAGGCFTYLNPAAEAMLGWTLADLRGRSMHESIHHRRVDGSSYPAAECPLIAARRDGVVVRVDGRPAPASDVFATASEGAGDPDVLGLGRLRRALSENGFVLLARPIVALASGAVVRHELLPRMIADDGAQIAPDEFLPTAERYGLISEIDRWVLREACALAAGGHAVQIDICAGTLADPDIGACVQRELVAAGAQPSLVGFEITASALGANEALVAAFVDRVRALGCPVVLGDFTVYAGLYLRRLQVDGLKIAREVVADGMTDPISERVVRAIVQLADGFALETMAEGVEDEDTLERLRVFGVGQAQGDQLGRALPAVDVLTAAALAPRVPA